MKNMCSSIHDKTQNLYIDGNAEITHSITCTPQIVLKDITNGPANQVLIH